MWLLRQYQPRKNLLLFNTVGPFCLWLRLLQKEANIKVR